MQILEYFHKLLLTLYMIFLNGKNELIVIRSDITDYLTVNIPLGSEVKL